MSYKLFLIVLSAFLTVFSQKKIDTVIAIENAFKDTLITDSTISNSDNNTTPSKLILHDKLTNDTITTPFCGIGIGWSIGSNKLLDFWRNNLPKTQNSLPESCLVFYTNKKDSIRFTIDKEPTSYNTILPLSISVIPFFDSTNYLSIKTGFWYTQKKSILSWRNDSSDSYNFFNIYNKISILSLFAGFKYNHKISKDFFTINNVDNSYITIGIYASPFTSFHLQKTNTTDYNYMKPYIKNINELWYGFSTSWEIGLSTLTSYSKNTVAVGIMYKGSYQGYFKNDIIKFDEFDSVSTEDISFFSNQFKLYITMYINKKTNFTKELNRNE